MNRTTLLSLVPTVILACVGGTAPGGPPRVTDVFNNKADFEAAQNRVGTARGFGFTGAYATTWRNVHFSPDCTVEFVRAQDFYVNTGASDAELQRILEQGYPDGMVTVIVTQSDGRVTVDSDSDGVESVLGGSIDKDGTVQAVFGTYTDERNYFGAVYNGRIQGSNFEGHFEARVHLLDDPTMPGSCSFLATLAP